MNSRQKIVLRYFILAALLIGLFPPWEYVAVGMHRSVGFHFLFSPPHIIDREHSIYLEARIEMVELIVECFTVILVAVALLLFFRSPEKKVDRE